MYPTAPDLVGHETVNILPWEDTVVAPVGFDSRSDYAEMFWLPVLGPSTLLLLRNIAQRFDAEPQGLALNIADTAKALGIGSRTGRNSAFHRSITRMVNFSMARVVDESTIAVRQILPPLHSGQLRRLTPGGRRLHQQYLSQRSSPSEEDLIRVTKVASTLLQLGDGPDAVEQQLVTWGVSAPSAKTAVDHAWAQKARDDSAAARIAIG